MFQVLEITKAPDMEGTEPQVTVLEISHPDQKELETPDSDVTPQAQVWQFIRS